RPTARTRTVVTGRGSFRHRRDDPEFFHEPSSRAGGMVLDHFPVFFLGSLLVRGDLGKDDLPPFFPLRLLPPQGAAQRCFLRLQLRDAAAEFVFGRWRHASPPKPRPSYRLSVRLAIEPAAWRRSEPSPTNNLVRSHPSAFRLRPCSSIPSTSCSSPPRSCWGSSPSGRSCRPTMRPAASRSTAASAARR